MNTYEDPIITQIESQNVVNEKAFPYIGGHSTTVENIGIAKNGKRYRFYTTYTTMTDGMTRIGSGYGYVELPAAST